MNRHCKKNTSQILRLDNSDYNGQTLCFDVFTKKMRQVEKNINFQFLVVEVCGSSDVHSEGIVEKSQTPMRHAGLKKIKMSRL